MRDTVSMRVTTFSDARAFLTAATPLLDVEPITANVIGSVTERLASDAPVADNLWATVADSDDRLVGAAMLNVPWNLFLTRMPTHAAIAIANRLRADAITLPGVTGERDATEAFATHWADRHGMAATTLVDERAHRLGILTPPMNVPGYARLAAPGDTTEIVSWLRAFREEAMPQDPAEDAMEIATRMIDQAELWLWEHDGRRVSMVGCRRPAAGAARIGPVYTPPDLRGRGYAGGTTAAAAAAALEAGAAHVMLYTDLSNPTSNALYARLGFIPDHEAVQIRFDRAT